MNRPERPAHRGCKFSVRLDGELDVDLIRWLDAQPEGRRSEAIRSLLRDGLQARELQERLTETIRWAVADALRDVQVVAAQQGITLDTNQVEEAFGSQLDQLLDRFG